MKNKDFKIDTQILKRKVGLSSIYFGYNQQHNRTFFGEDDGDFKPAVRRCLDGLWGVPTQSSFKRFLALKNYDSMVDSLNSLKNNGHRSSSVYKSGWLSKAAIAWDVSRYSDNIRHAYYLDYINKKTALDHLDCAYNMSKNMFESWEDYGKNFLLFKSIWDDYNLIYKFQRMGVKSSKDFNIEDIKNITTDHDTDSGISRISGLIEVVENLLKDRNSIWNQVSWNV